MPIAHSPTNPVSTSVFVPTVAPLGRIIWRVVRCPRLRSLPPTCQWRIHQQILYLLHCLFQPLRQRPSICRFIWCSLFFISLPLPPIFQDALTLVSSRVSRGVISCAIGAFIVVKLSVDAKTKRNFLTVLSHHWSQYIPSGQTLKSREPFHASPPASAHWACSGGELSSQAD